MADFDALIVGAGVIGLATARELAVAGRSVLVLEAGETIGCETSSRNSEVIHAGIYYPTGSLKARLCVAGKKRLYAYLAERGIAHRRCGKLVAAVEPGELPALERLHARGHANGVDDLELLSAAEARAREPALNAVGAMWSPSTGIFDSHAYMEALRADAQAAGATLVLRTPVERAEVAGERRFVVHAGGREPTSVTSAALVNCAGLHAAKVARAVQGLDPRHVPRLSYAKGSYFVLAGRAPFRTLVYPMPNEASLGLHLTHDLAGHTRFGPDVEWVESIDYDCEPGRAEVFYEAVRRFWPDLPDDSLIPGYCGVRPKLVGPGELPADFRIDGPEVHGVPGLVNLFGIESPGLTSSLAIASEVDQRFR